MDRVGGIFRCWGVDGWMDVWVGGWVDGWMDGWMNGWVDGWVNGWVNGWVDGWMDGWIHINHHTMGKTCRLIERMSWTRTPLWDVKGKSISDYPVC